jgi:hypothetical protein
VDILTLASGDSKIVIWDCEKVGPGGSCLPIHRLDAKSFGSTTVVGMNPRSALLATAGTELVCISRSITNCRCSGFQMYNRVDFKRKVYESKYKIRTTCHDTFPNTHKPHT